MGMTIPAGARIIWTDPPQVLHEGILTDLTEEQRIETVQPPKEITTLELFSVLESLEDLIGESHAIAMQLEEDPGNEELQAEMEAASAGMQKLVRVIPGSSTVLRAFGIDLSEGE